MPTTPRRAAGPSARAALSIFSRTWPPSKDAGRLAVKIAGLGFSQTHLNLASLGRPTLGDDLDAKAVRAIREAFQSAGVRIPSLSATYNMIGPDPARVRRETELAAALIRLAPALGARMVSLCTGSRHPTDKWAWHPDNAGPQAYEDLKATLNRLIPVARHSGIRLGIEPEPGNVINDTAAARRLLRDLGDDAADVGIIVDPGNLVTPANAGRQTEILDEAFDVLAEWIVAVHAKERGTGQNAALGSGIVDFRHFLRRWARLAQRVPIIIHDVTLADVRQAREFVLSHLEGEAA